MDTKIVLITGGSSGIGLEIAKQLMNKEMRVYSASRRGGKAQKSKKGGGEIIPVLMDVNDEGQIASTREQIIKENGRLDILICNAGNGISGSIEDTSTEEIKYQFETNFLGAVKTIQAFLPIFREQRYGKILATSSMAAIVPIPFQAFYSASKSALSVFMQALAMELKPFGVQCCTLLPGDTKTAFTASRKYTEKSISSDSIYYNKMKKAVNKMEQDEKNGMTASAVAKTVVNQLTRKKMSVKIVPGFQYKLIYKLFYIIPASLRLYIIEKVY